MAAPFTRYGDAVERYVDLGYLPIPIRPNEKRPAVSDWTNLSPARAISIALQHREAGIGVRTGSLAPLDVDVRNSNVATDLHQYIRRMLIQTAPELVRYGNPPKFLVLCQAEKAGPKRTSPLYRDRDGNEHRIECMGEGQQVVLAGIHPDTNEPYFWAKGDPLDQDVAVYELPVLTEEQWQALVDYFCKLAEAQGWERVSNERSAAQQGDLETPFAVAGLTLEMAGEALSCVPNDDLPYDEWLDVGMALHQQGKGEVDWFQLWDDWSTASSKYGGSRYNWKRWESFSDDRPGGITMRSVLMRAEDNGWTRPGSVEGARVEQEDEEMFENLDQQVSETPAKVEPDSGMLEVDLADLGMAEIPPQEYVMSKWLPLGFMALFSGHGGSGKSTLALQLAVHVAMGIDFAGHKVTRSKVLVYSAEDDTNMLRRRLQGIVRHLGVDPVELSKWMKVLDVTSINPALFVDTRGRGEQITGAFENLYKIARSWGASFVVVDNRSEVYASDENARGSVGIFCRNLNILSRRLKASTLLVAHVDKQTAKGMSSQRYSGSTQWFNSARSVMYLERTEREGVYSFEHDKLNVDKNEDPLDLGFEPFGGAGVLVPVDQSKWVNDRQRQREDEDDQAVLAALARMERRGLNVTAAKSGPGTAHAALSSSDELPDGWAGGDGKKRLKESLNRLHKDGKVALDRFQDQHRNTREKWVLCVSSTGWVEDEE